MANQIGTQEYFYNVFGDGQSNSITFDLTTVPYESGSDLLDSRIPDSIYLVSFTGAPTPIPSVTSTTVKGSVVTLLFDSALTTFDPVSQNGQYVVSFYLGFNS